MMSAGNHLDAAVYGTEKKVSQGSIENEMES